MNPLRVMNAYIMSLRNQVRIQRKEIWELQARLGRLEKHMGLESTPIAPQRYHTGLNRTIDRKELTDETCD